MRIVAAIDSFKGSMTSLEAGEAFARGVLAADPGAVVDVRPLADGGEGTIDALVSAMNGHYEEITVTGPLGAPVRAAYGILPEKGTAVIEMASIAGLPMVPMEQRNPLYTTTYGVGETILDAIDKGCRRFIVGIGGSATNDGGVGMLKALGYSFLDREGNPVADGAIGLQELYEIRSEGVPEVLHTCSFRVACDVTNPLCGELGASAIYGPQKGATPEMIRQMDKWLENYAALTKALYPAADADYPGTGAAGGLGFAFLNYLGAFLEPGIDIVMEETDLASWIRGADLVVTGEGCLDAQTAMGKAPAGVASLAESMGIPVVAVAGCVTPGAEVLHKKGVTAMFSIQQGASSLEDAMAPDNAKQNMTRTAEEIYRLFGLMR